MEQIVFFFLEEKPKILNHLGLHRTNCCVWKIEQLSFVNNKTKTEEEFLRAMQERAERMSTQF